MPVLAKDSSNRICILRIWLTLKCVGLTLEDPLRPANHPGIAALLPPPARPLKFK